MKKTTVKRVPKSLAKLVRTIRKFTADHGYPPSMRELAWITGDSTGTVDKNLAKLEGMGLVKRDEGVARSVRLIA